VERERDEATQKLESTTRRMERSTRDWQLERQNYEVRGSAWLELAEVTLGA
jgi:hypothetical protein